MCTLDRVKGCNFNVCIGDITFLSNICVLLMLKENDFKSSSSIFNHADEAVLSIDM